jgi:hypothetical protein
MLSTLGEEAKGAFERGLQWSLSLEPELLGPDSRMMILSGLLLVDPQRVPAVRKAFVPTEGPNEVDFLFAAVEADPFPLAWDEPDPFQRYVPDDLPQTLYDRHGIKGVMAHGGLAQGTMGKLEEPVLSWLRQDLWGYNLTHQLLSWVLCLKRGHRVEEAKERVLRLGARLGHELDHSQLTPFYDLVVESTTFLALAGYPLERLAGRFRTILATQEPDGGWWSIQDRAEFARLIETAHQGSSPLARPPRHYSEEADPERAHDSLVTLHRAHSSGLSIWALSILLHHLGAQST